MIISPRNKAKAVSNDGSLAFDVLTLPLVQPGKQKIVRSTRSGRLEYTVVPCYSTLAEAMAAAGGQDSKALQPLAPEMTFYTVAETAKILKCTDNQVYAMCQSNKLEFLDICTKTGARKQYRIPYAAIQKLLTPVQYAEPVKGSFRDRWLNIQSQK